MLIRRKITRQRAEAVQSLKVEEKVEAEVLGMKEIFSELLLSTETWKAFKAESDLYSGTYTIFV